MAGTAAALPSRLARQVRCCSRPQRGVRPFVVTKPSLAELAPATFLLWRFGFAAVVLLAVSARGFGPCRAPTGGAVSCWAGCSRLGSCSRRRDCRAPPQGSRASSPGGSLRTGALLTLTGAAGHITALSAWATPTNAVGVTTASVGVAAGVWGPVAARGSAGGAADLRCLGRRPLGRAGRDLSRTGGAGLGAGCADRDLRRGHHDGPPRRSTRTPRSAVPIATTTSSPPNHAPGDNSSSATTTVSAAAKHTPSASAVLLRCGA